MIFKINLNDETILLYVINEVTKSASLQMTVTQPKCRVKNKLVEQTACTVQFDRIGCVRMN